MQWRFKERIKANAANAKSSRKNTDQAGSSIGGGSCSSCPGAIRPARRRAVGKADAADDSSDGKLQSVSAISRRMHEAVSLGLGGGGGADGDAATS